MKKTIAILLSIVMLTALLTGCGGSPSSPSPSDNSEPANQPSGSSPADINSSEPPEGWSPSI